MSISQYLALEVKFKRVKGWVEEHVNLKVSNKAERMKFKI